MWTLEAGKVIQAPLSDSPCQDRKPLLTPNRLVGPEDTWIWSRFRGENPESYRHHSVSAIHQPPTSSPSLSHVTVHQPPQVSPPPPSAWYIDFRDQCFHAEVIPAQPRVTRYSSCCALMVLHHLQPLPPKVDEEW